TDPLAGAAVGNKPGFRHGAARPRAGVAHGVGRGRGLHGAAGAVAPQGIPPRGPDDRPRLAHAAFQTGALEPVPPRVLLLDSRKPQGVSLVAAARCPTGAGGAAVPGADVLVGTVGRGAGGCGGVVRRLRVVVARAATLAQGRRPARLSRGGECRGAARLHSGRQRRAHTAVGAHAPRSRAGGVAGRQERDAAATSSGDWAVSSRVAASETVTQRNGVTRLTPST